MNWHSLLAALLIALVLTGCAQETTGQAGAQYPPHSPVTTGLDPSTAAGMAAVAAVCSAQRVRLQQTIAYSARLLSPVDKN
jgi:hypothetical protein